MAVTQVPISGANTLVGFTITLPFTVNDQFSFSFPYLDQADFKIEVASTTVLDTADYEFVSDYLIQLTQIGVDKLNALYVAPLTEVDLVLSRSTTLSNRLVDFQDGANLTEEELDLNSNQAFYLLQEAYDTFLTGSLTLNPVTGVINAKNSEIINVAESSTLTSAATLNTVLDNVTTPDYEEFAVYRTGKLVFIGDNIYRAIVDIDSAPATPDLGDFELVIDVAALAAAVAVFDDVAANTAAITVNSDNLTAHEAEQDAHQEIDTETNLVTWAASANNGDHAYATDTKKYYGVEDGELTEFGGGGAGDRSTSLLSGGAMTINADPTKVDIAALTGIVVDAHTDPTSDPVITEVTYAGATGISVPNLSTEGGNAVFMDSTGTVSFIPVPEGPVPNDLLRDKFLIGVTINDTVAGEVIAINEATATLGVSYGHQINDLSFAIGVINLEGNVFSAASTDMTIAKTAGKTYFSGQNFKADKKDPSVVSIGAFNPTTFQYVFKDGSGGYNFTAPTTSIVADAYDDGTGGTTEPNGTVANNRYSIQRLYVIANAAAFVHYGQATYTSFADAIDGMQTEAFEATPQFATALFRGFLIVKGNATDLSNSSQAMFVAADKFGSRGSSGGATGAITDLATAYDNSTDPEIVLSTTVGALSINQGNITSGNSLFEVEDTAGTTKLLKVTNHGTSVTDRDGTTVVKEESDILHRETFKLNAPSSLYTVTGVSTVTNETASPISGYQSAKFTQVAGSQDDLITLTNGIPLSRKALSQTVALLMDVTYSGNDSDIKVKILQSDDDITYDEVAYALLGNTSEVSKMGLATDFRSTATHFKYEFEVLTETIGAVLEFDDVRLSSDPFKKISTQSAPSIVSLNTFSAFVDTNVHTFSNIEEDTGDALTYDSVNGTVTVNKTVIASISGSSNFSGAGSSVIITKNETSVSYTSNTLAYQEVSNAADQVSVSWEGKLVKGDVIRLISNGGSVNVNARVRLSITATPLTNESVIVESSDSVVSEWTSFTPTVSAGFGTVSNNVGKWKRNGDTMEIQASFTAGTTTTSEGTISLPSGYFLDADKLSINNISTAEGSAVGTFARNSTQANTYGSMVTAPSTSTSVIYFSRSHNDTTNHLLPSTSVSAQVAASSEIISVNISVPIAGWSATPKPLLALPTITYGGEPEMIRLNTGNGHGSTNTKIRRITNIIQDTSSSLFTYTDSVADGTAFTATQRCKVSISYTDSSSSAATAIGLSLNSSQLTTDIFSINEADKLGFLNTTQAAFEDIVSWTGILEAGDIIRPHGNGTANATTGVNSCLFTLTAEPILGQNNQAHIIAQPVAFVEDQKPSGTAGGTSTTAPTARDLNTLSGDIAAVGVVLDGTDGFKLTEGGKFKIEWSAPSYESNNHKSALYNETTSSYLKQGTSMHSWATDATVDESSGSYVGTFPAGTILSIHHEVVTSKAMEGFGKSVGGLLTIDQDGAANELYTRVTITRLK